MLTLIPKNSLQAKYSFCNSSNTVVNVSIRGSPEFGNSTTIEIGKCLHGPTNLSYDLLVGESRHCTKWFNANCALIQRILTIRMGPGVDGEVTSSFNGDENWLWAITIHNINIVALADTWCNRDIRSYNVTTDHEMSRFGRYVVLSQKVVKTRTDVCGSIVEGKLYSASTTSFGWRTAGQVYNTHGPDLLAGGREQIFGFDTLSGERTNTRVPIVLIVRVSRNLATSCRYRNIWHLHGSEFI